MPEKFENVMGETGPFSSWEPVSRGLDASAPEDAQQEVNSLDAIAHVENEADNPAIVPSPITAIDDPQRDNQRRASLATMQPPPKRSAFLSTASFFKLPHLTALRPQTSPVSANRKDIEQAEPQRNIEALDLPITKALVPAANDGADLVTNFDDEVQKECRDTQDRPADQETPANVLTNSTQQSPAVLPADKMTIGDPTSEPGSRHEFSELLVDDMTVPTEADSLIQPVPTETQARASEVFETANSPQLPDTETRFKESLETPDERPLSGTSMPLRPRSSSLNTQYPPAEIPVRDMSSPYAVKLNPVKCIQQPTTESRRRKRLIKKTRQLLLGKHVLVLLLGTKAGDSAFMALHGIAAEQVTGPIPNLDGAAASMAVVSSATSGGGGSTSGHSSRYISSYPSRKERKSKSKSKSSSPKSKDTPAGSRKPSQGSTSPRTPTKHAASTSGSKPRQQSLRNSAETTKKTEKRGKWKRKIKRMLSKLFRSRKSK